MILPIIIASVLIAMAGMAEGFNDALLFHYWKVAQRIRLNPNFFDYTISYLNKYKQRQPAAGLSFRGRFLIFTTDSFHLLKWAQHLFIFSSLATLLYVNVHWNWYFYVLAALSAWGLRGIGFTIGFTIFK